MRIVAAAAIVLALATQLSHAAPEAQVADAVKVFLQARDGQDKQIEPAIAAFETLAKAEPSNPLFAAYLGSALGLKAREAWAPWSKLKFSEQGLDHLDRALGALKPEHDRLLVRGVPVSLETRLVAASMFVTLPDGIFHRRAAGRKLLDETMKHPAFAAAPEPFRASVQRAAADAARASQ